MIALLAMSHGEGTALTVLIIVALVVFCGVLLITDDTDWFN